MYIVKLIIYFMMILFNYLLIVLNVAYCNAVKYDNEKIHVHIVCHTHDDPGWLKTIDQYFYGSNSSIYDAGVQYILDTVYSSLLLDENRKFIYAEMSFFTLWYEKLNEQHRKNVKRLVERGQLSFVNGGWCMHDEASAHYVSMIDQTTLGHKFLKEEFDYIPNIGWQIDPFGHSNTNAWFSAEFGFDGLFFGRIHHQDHKKRLQEKHLELLWRGSASLPQREVFTGVFSSGNYGPPAGFCFDKKCNVDPIMDHPEQSQYNNVDSYVTNFITALEYEHSVTQGSHIMLKMGSDFQYENADVWFKNLDKLIKYTNQASDKFQVFYSTPAIYLEAKQSENIMWPVKTDDFFPYADCDHCYWGGYFTSRPTLKYLERVSSSFLQAYRKLLVMSKFPPYTIRAIGSSPTSASASGSSNRDILSLISSASASFQKVERELLAAVSLANHHDAITGTSKQHVADDYTRLLDKALTSAERATASIVTAILSPSLPASSLTICRTVNESMCSETQSAGLGDEVLVVLFNQLSYDITHQITVYLSDIAKEAVIVVESEESGYLSSQLLPTWNDPNLPVIKQGAPWSLVFTAEKVPPLTFARFRIRLLKSREELKEEESRLGGGVPIASKTLPQLLALPVIPFGVVLSFTSTKVEITLDGTTGLLKSIRRLDDMLFSDEAVEVSQDLCYYSSFGEKSHPDKGEVEGEVDQRDPPLQNTQPHESLTREDSLQYSGAYIFRPSPDRGLRCIAGGNPSATSSTLIGLSAIIGREVTEIRQVFADWAVQVIRLRRDAMEVEIEWVVGPIPVDDGWGKEVMSVYRSGLDSGGSFYTDSNGREMLERRRDKMNTWELNATEPVAGNIYPITSAAFIKDSTRNLQLTVLTDRAQGMASLSSGSMEFMVHRRTLQDDRRGVGEPLDETDGGMSPYPAWQRSGKGIRVRGRHVLLLSESTTAATEMRSAMDELYFTPVELVGASKGLWSRLHAYRAKLSSVKEIVDSAPLTAFCRLLPENIQVVTLAPMKDRNSILLRLGHRLARSESASTATATGTTDPASQGVITIDLAALLHTIDATEFEELSLSANQNKSVMNQKKFKWSATKPVTLSEVDSAGDIGRVSLEGISSFKILIQPMQIRTFVIYL